MAAPSLASSSATATFDVMMRAEPELYGTKLRDVTPPGVDGASLQKTAKRADPFIVDTVARFDTLPDARAELTKYHNMRGEMLSMVDAFGVSWSSGQRVFACLRVLPLPIKLAQLAVSQYNTGNYIVRARWWLQNTEL
jgi:hypothetical protein